MKLFFQKYLVASIAWGIIAFLIVLFSAYNCFSYGDTPGWCGSFLHEVVHWTIGFPALVAFNVFWFFGLGSYPGIVQFIIFTVLTFIFSLLATFLLVNIVRIIRKLRFKL